jgi:hypothetical protein
LPTLFKKHCESKGLSPPLAGIRSIAVSLSCFVSWAVHCLRHHTNGLSPLSAGIRFIAANVSRCGLCSNFGIVPSVYDAAVVPRVGLNLHVPSCLRFTISCIHGHRTSCPRYARATASPRVSPPLAGILSIAVMLPLIPSVYNAVVVPWAGLNPMSCFALPYAASCISEQPTMPSPTGSYCIP